MEFSAPRFVRVLKNDALRFARPVLFTTVALFGLTVLLYLLNPRQLSGGQAFSQALFGTGLIGTGLLLTSTAFQDMHHRLDRYQYLMLPVSGFERLLSRFLLTGPLFVLFALLAFMIFDLAGKQVVLMYQEARAPLFQPFTAATKWLVISYMVAHAVMLTGAICFRTHALLRTLLVLLAMGAAVLVVENIAERLLFPDLFTWTRFESIAPLPVELMPGFSAEWMNVVVIAAIVGWILHVAWLCLRDHETTDGV